MLVEGGQIAVQPSRLDSAILCEPRLDRQKHRNELLHLRDPHWIRPTFPEQRELYQTGREALPDKRDVSNEVGHCISKRVRSAQEFVMQNDTNNPAAES